MILQTFNQIGLKCSILTKTYTSWRKIVWWNLMHFLSLVWCWRKKIWWRQLLFWPMLAFSIFAFVSNIVIIKLLYGNLRSNNGSINKWLYYKLYNFSAFDVSNMMSAPPHNIVTLCLIHEIALFLRSHSDLHH